MVTISCYNWFIIKLWLEMFIYKCTDNYTPLFQFCQTNDVSYKKIWSEETFLIFLCSQLLYLVMSWRNSGSDLLIHKPPLRWNTDDVVQWLSDLGSWTADYREEARRNQLGSYKNGLESSSFFKPLIVFIICSWITHVFFVQSLLRNIVMVR